MEEPTKPDLSYVCPNCGQKAVIGAHFCRNAPKSATPAQEAKTKSGGASGNRWIYAVAGTFLAVVVLWRWLGPASLLAVALVLLVVLAFQQSKNNPGGAAYRNLVKICGNEDAAERLIAAELKRKPKSTRRQAARAALERYQRDITR